MYDGLEQRVGEDRCCRLLDSLVPKPCNYLVVEQLELDGTREEIFKDRQEEES